MLKETEWESSTTRWRSSPALPGGSQARRRHAGLKVAAYERMVAERPKDTKLALVLMQAREDLQALDAAASSAKER